MTDETITSPGKFEGEATYLPYFYEMWLDGGLIDTWDGDTLISIVAVEPRDVALYPALAGRKTVKFFEDEQGFVREIR